MTEKTKKLISGVRDSLLLAEQLKGPMPLYDDLFELIGELERLDRRCETLEWMLEVEGKLIDIEHYNKHSNYSPPGPTESPTLPGVTPVLKAK